MTISAEHTMRRSSRLKLINNGYTPLQRKIVEFSKKAVRKCPQDNKSLHCSVLVYQGIIISYGINKESVNHDFAIGYQHKSVHAEWSCLQRFKKMNPLKEMHRVDLYSVRITRNGTVKNAKPCRMCHSTIQANMPRKVFYTTDVGEFIQWQS
jgi:tRNA(Arg) A34 adenosine deaminase TadA